VKLLGDSVMAYFFSPREALKSAITIQQRFQSHNQGKDLQNQIHIRICIHFGDGIVEEKDIFGDVVNMAAKLLPMVDGDQIFISQEVHEQVDGLASTYFTPVKISDNEGTALRGLTAYGVTWDETINLEPIMKILVYFKPAWNLGKKDFSAIWRSLLQNKKKLWTGDRIVKESILTDKSIVLLVKEAPFSLTLAKNVMEFLKLNMGHSGTLFIPVQIVIDSGPYLRADKLALEDLKVNWQEIEPGEIYISPSVYEAVKNGSAFSLAPLSDTMQHQSFFKITLNGHHKSDSHIFLYQKALIQGDNSPCFYCGDKRHLTANCPSKQLPEVTNVFNKLGYLALDEINNLFFSYLTEASDQKIELSVPGEGVENDSTQWAHQAFYELKTVYQLRLFRTLWNLMEENWHKIKERKGVSDKGGLLWIGLDCIRVSNTGQAESILQEILLQKPNDYKPYCAMGFLKIEKKDLSQAKTFYKKALEHAKTTPQKIMILFLLSRIYYLNNELLRAKEMIRRILRLSPYCPEALYQDILFKFQKGDKAVALHQLTKLIKTNRDYYIISLIDPELADFSEITHPELEHLSNEAREEAVKIAPEAKYELDRLETLMGKGSKEVSEAIFLLSKIDELSKTDSYFGYLDIIHYGKSIINMSRRCVEGRKMRLSKITRDLREHLRLCIVHVDNLAYPSLTESVSREIRLLQERVDKNRDMAESVGADEFKKALARLEQPSAELHRIESRLKRLDSIVQVVVFIIGFLKKSLIFQSANLVIALILFPIATHYLNFILPEFKITPQNTWYCQKMFIILGGISGLILAGLTTKTETPKG